MFITCALLQQINDDEGDDDDDVFHMSLQYGWWTSAH